MLERKEMSLAYDVSGEFFSVKCILPCLITLNNQAQSLTARCTNQTALFLKTYVSISNQFSRHALIPRALFVFTSHVYCKIAAQRLDWDSIKHVIKTNVKSFGK